MKFNKWTLGLAAVGAVSMASAVRADDAPKLSQLNTALSSTTISGYVDTAAQYNLGNAGGNTTPVTYAGGPGVVDGFSLNVVDIAIDKPEDESPWASGYHVEFNAGQDALNAIIGSSVGIRQAYVTLRTPVGNGIDWKFGAFDAITGYEGNTGYANPNYTRSYGWAANPASQVGLLGIYKVSNALTVQAGIVNRDVPSQSDEASATPTASSKTYEATAALTAPDNWGWFKGSTLNLGIVQTFDSHGVNNYNASLTFNTPIANLTGGLSYDKVQTLGFNGGEAEDGSIYGVYASYQQTDKLKYSLRGEYLDTANLDEIIGFGKGEEITATVEYDLWANVVSRAEFRWDHTEHGTYFNNNNTENALLLALNVVYKF
jgi:hypothetical protein